MVTQGPVAPSGWVLSGRANFGASESHYAPVTGGCQREFTPHLVRPLAVPPNIQANDPIAARPSSIVTYGRASGRPVARPRLGPATTDAAGTKARTWTVSGRRGRETGCIRSPAGCCGSQEDWAPCGAGYTLQEQGGCHPENGRWVTEHGQLTRARPSPLPHGRACHTSQSTHL